MASCVFFFLIAVVIWLLSIPFDKRKILLHYYSGLWGSLYIWINPFWPFRVRGRSKIRDRVPSIIVSNHQSFLDILVLYALYRQYKFVSKKEVFALPIIGWLMVLNQYIPLRRGSRESIQKMMQEIKKNIERGSSIMMFPEGTRNKREKELLPFKEGAFAMALQNKVPIIPVVLYGTGRTIPKGKLLIQRKQKIIMQIMDPVSYESFKRMQAGEIATMLRARMQETYDKISSDA